MAQPLNSANLRRAAVLWQIGQNLARARQRTHDPKRDMCITIGSGSGDHYTPDVRMTMGSALLAHAVANGELEVAFVNPTSLLTQAYRGVGLFQQPLPVRALAVYPSLDHFIFALHPRLGIRSFTELGERRPAMRVSIRLDETHATRVLLDQTLAAYNLSMRDLELWGCSFHYVSSPSDARRLSALREDQLDAVFDEGIRGWFPVALECGLQPLMPGPEAVRQLQALGWRAVTIKAGRFPGLEHDCEGIDFSGWPLYTRESLQEDVAYDIVDALSDGADDVPWEEEGTLVSRLGSDAPDTPLDVPLHPGAERWYRERA